MRRGKAQQCKHMCQWLSCARVFMLTKNIIVCTNGSIWQFRRHLTANSFYSKLHIFYVCDNKKTNMSIMISIEMNVFVFVSFHFLYSISLPHTFMILFAGFLHSFNRFVQFHIWLRLVAIDHLTSPIYRFFSIYTLRENTHFNYRSMLIRFFRHAIWMCSLQCNLFISTFGYWFVTVYKINKNHYIGFFCQLNKPIPCKAINFMCLYFIWSIYWCVKNALNLYKFSLIYFAFFYLKYVNLNSIETSCKLKMSFFTSC